MELIGAGGAITTLTGADRPGVRGHRERRGHGADDCDPVVPESAVLSVQSHEPRHRFGPTAAATTPATTTPAATSPAAASPSVLTDSPGIAHRGRCKADRCESTRGRLECLGGGGPLRGRAKHDRHELDGRGSFGDDHVFCRLGSRVFDDLQLLRRCCRGGRRHGAQLGCNCFDGTATRRAFRLVSSLSLKRGSLFAGPVASFTDANTTTSASQFVAMINWGDGRFSVAAVSGGAGSFVVNAHHSYAKNGHYALDCNGDHDRSEFRRSGSRWHSRRQQQPAQAPPACPDYSSSGQEALAAGKTKAQVERSPGIGSRELESVALHWYQFDGASNMTKPIRVAVTGAGGQIGYALLFRLASGAAFGPDQPVALQLLEITPGAAGARWIIDGAGGLRVPALERRVRDRQAGAGVRRSRLGDPGWGVAS